MSDAGLPPAEGPASSSRKNAVLAITSLGSLMVAVDSTIVILALPTMAGDLHAGLSSIIWTILIYLLITATLTTQVGRLGDMLGRAWIYNLGFAVFTIGSVLSGLATTATFLIAARSVQAVGGAMVFAIGGALIADVFPAHERGRAFGFLAFGWSVGAILGILLGGVITTALGWRYIFFINLPIGVAAVALGLKYLPITPRTATRFDLGGFVTFSAALGSLCYGAIEAAAYGPDATNLACVAIGLALLPVFVVVELRNSAPMLDLRGLRQRLLGFSLLAGFLQSLGYLSVVFLLTMYLQGLRGLSPLNASLLLIPGYLVGALTAPWMGRRVDRIGPRVLATLGIVLMMAAVVAYSFLSLTSWLGFVPIISLLSGVGVGTFYPANNTAIMDQATPRTFGSISGLRATLTNLGTLFSFVLSLSIASASVSRPVAEAVFLGTTGLVGNVGAQFLTGIRVALLGSAVVLVVAALLSWSRGAAPSTGVPAATSGTGP